MWLVVEDTQSKWLEVMTTTTTKSTISCLEGLFSRYGYPKIKVSDNGSQLTTHEFHTFCKSLNIKRAHITPYHPKSNGLAEQCVEKFKERMSASQGNSGTVQENLNRFLFAHITSPKRSTWKTPAFIMFGHDLGNKLDLLLPYVDGSAWSDENNQENINGNVRKRPSRNICSKELVKEQVQEYCNNSTIHGLKYIGGPGRHIVERAWWMVIFILSIGGSAYMIHKVWRKWQDSPVIVSFAESSTPVWEIPFPAVTICSEAKSQNRKFNITESIYKNITDEREKKFLDSVSLVCDNHVNSDSPNQLIDEDGVDIIRNVAPSIDSVLFLCRWKLGKPQDCNELFVPVMTEEGHCFSFNTLHPTDAFRDGLVLQKYPKDARNISRFWTLGNGYDNQAPLDVYPKRALGAGAKSGLFIVLRTYRWDLDYYCRGPVQGYKIKLHNPAEIPQIGESYFRVPLDSEIVLSVKANMMTTSESLLSYSPNKRQCFFPYERYLKYFKVYTQSNCQLECLTNFTMKQCKCTKFHMPRFPETAICGAGLKNCTITALDNLNIQQITQALIDLNIEGSCNCLPACTSIKYDAETSQAPFDYKALFGAFKENETDPDIFGGRLSRVSIYFKESQFITSRRRELIGYADFLSQCGGLLGLFSGFSILSLVEIIYYVTLRLWYNRENAKKQETVT